MYALFTNRSQALIQIINLQYDHKQVTFNF